MQILSLSTSHVHVSFCSQLSQKNITVTLKFLQVFLFGCQLGSPICAMTHAQKTTIAMSNLKHYMTLTKIWAFSVRFQFFSTVIERSLCDKMDDRVAKVFAESGSEEEFSCPVKNI